jgi:hypothetical protein
MNSLACFIVKYLGRSTIVLINMIAFFYEQIRIIFKKIAESFSFISY